MTDTSFLPPSPWMSDVWTPRDSLMSSESGLITDDLLFGQLEPEGQLITSKPYWDGASDFDLCDWRSPSPFHGYDAGMPATRCVDEPSVDIEVNLEECEIMRDAGSKDCLTSAILATDAATKDYLTATVVGLLGEDLDCCDDDFQTESVTVGEWQDGSSDDEDVAMETRVNSPSSSTAMSHRCVSPSITEKINWSRLSPEERKAVADSVSSVVRTHLGPREQLEVFHIISRDTRPSLTDAKLDIDIEDLDADKLEKVQSLLKQYLKCNHNNNNNNRSQCKRPLHPNHHSCRSKSFSCHDDCTCCHGNMSEVAGEDMKGKNSRLKTPKLTAKQRRQQQRKRLRQDLKERRSGLFAQEQVLAVTVVTADSDAEDVDILT